MKHLVSCLSIVAALALSACAPTQTSRGTGEVVDDAGITARVNKELTQTGGLGQAMAINVDTFRGVVSLSGFVDSEKEKSVAEQAAKRVPGVARVENNLQLKPKTSSGQ